MRDEIEETVKEGKVESDISSFLEEARRDTDTTIMDESPIPGATRPRAAAAQ